MNEEQNKKFEEWLHRQKFLKRFDGFSPTLTDLVMAAKDAWQACLDANKVEEPEPTSTEMVKRLLEKGWEIVSYERGIGLYHPHKDKIIRYSIDGLKSAYYQEFPRRKKVEVEVWLDTKLGSKYVSSLPLVNQEEHRGPKGIATFWVEEDRDEGV